MLSSDSLYILCEIARNILAVLFPPVDWALYSKRFTRLLASSRMRDATQITTVQEVSSTAFSVTAGIVDTVQTTLNMKSSSGEKAMEPPSAESSESSPSHRVFKPILTELLEADQPQPVSR